MEPKIAYGHRARLGMLLPSGNVAAEPQIAAMLPAGVSLHTTRLELVGSSDTQLLRMTADIERGAALLGDADVDLILFNCTAVSTWNAQKEAEIIARIEGAAGVPAITTSQALTVALRQLNAQKIILVTPYISGIVLREIAFLERAGFEVLASPSLELDTPAEMFAVPPKRWLELSERNWRTDADVCLISCTAIRSAEIIAPLEVRLGRPVLTSNQAATWLSLRELGIAHSGDRFGMLFGGLAGYRGMSG